MMKHPIRGLAAIAAAAALAACGGGGSDSSAPTASQASFPVAKAYRDHYVNGETARFEISVTSGQTTCNGTGTMTTSKAIPTTFENAPAVVSTETLAASFTNCSPANLSLSAYTILDTNFRPFGGSSPGDYRVYPAPRAALPESAKVGESFVLGTANRYSNPTKASFLGTAVTTYSLQPDTETTALVAVVTTDVSPNGTATASTTQTVRIGTDGSYRVIGVESAGPGGRLSARRID